MTSAAVWAQRGRDLLSRAEFEEAQAAFARAIELEPNVGLHWALLGKCEAMRLGYHAAHDALARACALAPDSAFMHVWLGHALRERNDPEAASAAYARASILDRNDVTAAIGAALVMPVIYRDEQEIERWRARHAEQLERLRHSRQRWDGWAQSVLRLEWSNFYLAYQGRNDRDLQTAYSDFVAGLLARAAAQWQQPLEPRRDDASGRIRVAFVSAHLCRHTVTDYFARWITDLPRERFAVSAFHSGTRVDECTQVFRASVDRFAQVPSDAHQLAAALREQAPDVIVYPDVGMSPHDVLLTNLRLAPTQIAAWGHPVTTGSAYIDAYLSCAAMEPADARSHYSEPLVLLPGIGVDYAPVRASAAADRAAFRLSREAHLYVCPQSLFKIHPATDALFLDILEQDEAAQLLFFAAPAKAQTDAFVARLTSGMRVRGVPMRNQVKLLPHVSREHFAALLGCCDVMLDPLHWSGGNTALDALAAGLPIVTLPGSEMRGRQSAAMLRLIGMDDLVASDARDYVAKALRVASDRAHRAALSARIDEGLPKLFHRHDAIAALADAIERVRRRDAAASSPHLAP
ncbi:MAG TPA: hypothetical protein VFB32_00010 [Rudaea sp.]|nr:hypothetical protein [Rudaea sp.]